MLELVGVSKKFGRNTVLTNFSAKFLNGIHLITGPNGSGKTTLLSIVACLCHFNSGEIFYNGNRIQKEKERLNFLKELDISHSGAESFFQQLTGKENLEFFASCNQQDIDLDHFSEKNPELYKELESLLEIRFHTFSSGMKRKLSLFRALLSHSKLVLLDEPFTHLDEHSIHLVVEYLKNQKERIFIIASHRKEFFADTPHQVWGL